MYLMLHAEKYFKIFAQLEDDEIGRLVWATLGYLNDEPEPEAVLVGKERTLWPVVKWDIDHNDGDEPDNSDAPLRNAGKQCGG